MINIKEKDGKIIFNDTQEFNQDNLLVKYRNDEMTKKLLESQLVKLPERIKQTEAQKGMLQDHIELIEKRLIQFEDIFKARNLNPKEELNKLREKYTDEELTKISEQISEKQTFEVKDNGHSISRITKNEFSIEELIIIYASNQYNKLNTEEKIILRFRVEGEYIHIHSVVYISDPVELGHYLSLCQRKRNIMISFKLSKYWLYVFAYRGMYGIYCRCFNEA